MKLSVVLETLYSENLDEIVSLLNGSVYAKEFPLDKSNINVIHTGFRFELHTGTEMELYYDIYNELLIYQKQIGEVPVLGVLYEFDLPFVKGYYQAAYAVIDENNSENNTCYECELTKDLCELPEMKVIEYGNGRVLNFHKRFKVLTEKVYFNHNHFSIWDSSEDDYW